MNTTEASQPAALGSCEWLGSTRLRTRAELVEALRLIGGSMGGACNEAADMLEADGRTLNPQPTQYGCHCDLEPGMKPDGCVLDYGNPNDCTHAPGLVAAGKRREDCHEWRPVVFVSA